jgi:hypothetical protein
VITFSRVLDIATDAWMNWRRLVSPRLEKLESGEIFEICQEIDEKFRQLRDALRRESL